RQQVELIQDFFAERQLYIADGHHRYTTALNYREEIREQQRELPPMDGVNFVLMALIDLDDPGMLVLPTHRILSALSQESLSCLSHQQLARYFTVEPLDSAVSTEAVLTGLAHVGARTPSRIVKTAQQTLLLSLNEQGTRRMEQSGHSAAW